MPVRQSSARNPPDQAGQVPTALSLSAMLHRNSLVSTSKNDSGIVLIDLIGDPRQAFLAAEHRQHVEHAGRSRPARQGGTQRLRDRAELQTRSPRRRRGPPPRSRPRSSRPQRRSARRARRAARRAAARRAAPCAFSSIGSGRSANRNARRRPVPPASWRAPSAPAWRRASCALRFVVQAVGDRLAVLQIGQGAR